MTSHDSPPLILDTPQDLLLTIPFLLGFHPQDSLVVLSINPERRLARVMRAEIIVPNERDSARELIGALSWQNIEGVMLVAYTSGDGLSFLEMCENEIKSAGFSLIESIVVNETHWISRLCESECGSCPHEGNPLPAFESSRIAVEHVIRGHVMPCVSEHDLAATLAQVGAPIACDGEILPLPEAAALLRRVWERWQVSRTLLPAEMGPTLRALENLALRDYAITMHSSEQLLATVELWRTLLAQAPLRYRAPVACLLAATSYEAGEGGLARLALDEATKDDPEYSLARLLTRAMEAGWPPEAFTRMRQELAEKLGALVYEAA